MIKNLPANVEDTGDIGLSPGLGISPGVGNGNPLPLQHSCLENPMDRGAWWATIQGAAKSGTRLSTKHKCMAMFSNWWISSVQVSHSVVSNSLRPHGLPHARPPCPSPTPGVYSNSCPLRQWCHPTISSSVVPFSPHLQSFPESGSFQMSQLFASGGQTIGISASASVLPMNIQDWSPLGWTGWISLQSKGLSRVFSNTTVQKQYTFYSSSSPSIGQYV